MTDSPPEKLGTSDKPARVCTCRPIVRQGRPPLPSVDPECPVHGWQDAGLARWLRGRH